MCRGEKEAKWRRMRKRAERERERGGTGTRKKGARGGEPLRNRSRRLGRKRKGLRKR